MMILFDESFDEQSFYFDFRHPVLVILVHILVIMMHGILKNSKRLGHKDSSSSYYTQYILLINYIFAA